MKKIYKTFLLLSMPLVAAPFATSLTSCVNAFSGQARLYISTDKYDDKTRYGQLPISNFNLKKISYGTKDFYKGNYSLVFGSNYYDKTMGFLFDDYMHEKRDILNKAIMNGSPFVKAINEYRLNNPVDFEKNEIGFASYIDNEILGPEGTNLTSPFAKWTKADEDDDDKHKENHFKREDISAREFRSFVDTLKILFDPDKFKDEELNDNVWAIYWKDGSPVKIETALTKEKYLTSLNEVYKTKK